MSERPSGGANSRGETCFVGDVVVRCLPRGDVSGDVSGDGKSRTPLEVLGGRTLEDPDSKRGIPEGREDVRKENGGRMSRLARDGYQWERGAGQRWADGSAIPRFAGSGDSDAQSQGFPGYEGGHRRACRAGWGADRTWLAVPPHGPWVPVRAPVGK